MKDYLDRTVTMLWVTLRQEATVDRHTGSSTHHTTRRYKFVVVSGVEDVRGFGFGEHHQRKASVKAFVSGRENRIGAD